MSLFFPDGLEFYPKHPSPIKTHKIQTSPMPILKYPLFDGEMFWEGAEDHHH